MRLIKERNKDSGKKFKTLKPLLKPEWKLKVLPLEIDSSVKISKPNSKNGAT
jgi:hypothetical protein